MSDEKAIVSWNTGVANLKKIIKVPGLLLVYLYLFVPFYDLPIDMVCYNIYAILSGKAF